MAYESKTELRAIEKFVLLKGWLLLWFVEIIRFLEQINPILGI